MPLLKVQGDISSEVVLVVLVHGRDRSLHQTLVGPITLCGGKLHSGQW